MDRGSWRRPVVLEIFGRPGLLTVADTLDAALVLLGVWPTKRTEAHVVAVKSCRDVLTGRAVPALARADFIEAALEAGFHVQPETFLEEAETVYQEAVQLRTGTDGWVAGPVIVEPSPARLSPSSGFRDARLPQDWHHPANANVQPPAALPEGPQIRQLLRSLSETIGMIGVVMLRKAAGMLNGAAKRQRAAQQR